jgi:hypothetical protein
MYLGVHSAAVLGKRDFRRDIRDRKTIVFFIEGRKKPFFKAI